jgi:hypothetical protein
MTQKLLKTGQSSSGHQLAEFALAMPLRQSER